MRSASLLLAPSTQQVECWVIAEAINFTYNIEHRALNFFRILYYCIDLNRKN